AFCPVIDQDINITHNQTIVIDVGDQIFGVCPSGQGFIIAQAAQQCVPTPPATTCPTATGGSFPGNEIAPISYNHLFGSYFLYYNGSTNPPGTLCNGVPCSPPATGLVPDVEAANALAFESQQPMFSLLGNDIGGAVSLTFGTTTAFDYVAFPARLQTSFAAPGAALIAGPSTFTPFIPPDTASGTELQTNIILLNLNVNLADAVPPVAMGVNAWNWFAVGFSSVHRVLCWERMPIDLIDPRLTAAGPFGANYGTIRFTPSPLTGPSSPHLLGVIEEVSTVGRTIRNMLTISPSASPGIFMNPAPAANLGTFITPE